MKKYITQNLRLVFSKIISYASLMACVAFYLSASQAIAKSKDSIFKKNRQELRQIENYLNNIKNLSAKFTQQTSDGNLVEGLFFLSRPGKMRIEYKNEPPIVIVVNGAILSYYDVELDEISRLSTNTTPASFLTRKNISFAAKDVEITNFSKKNNLLKVSVMKKNRKDSGEFSLVFSQKPFAFKKMEVKNDLDQIIEVTLYNIDLKSPISKQKFILRKSEE